MSNTENFGQCANCGEQLHGKHCHKCGEKKISKDDLTVKNFIGQTIDIFTHFDSKIFKSLILLLKKPGFLVSENIEGRRVKYAKPIQLFFIINIIYFFFLSYLDVGFDAVTNRSSEHMDNLLYGHIATSLVNEKIKEKNIPFEEYDNNFYDEIYIESKLLIIFMIPIFALWFKLIYRKQKILYYEHLVFSTYFFCFILLFYTFILNAVVYPVIYKTPLSNYIEPVISYDTLELVAEIIVLILAAVYLFFSIRQVYKESLQQTLLKTFLSLIGLIVTFNLFKFLIFLAVFYTT